MIDDNLLTRAAANAALNSARAVWEGPAAAVNPNSSLKSLSNVELGWIVNMAISEWICERSRQISSVRGVDRLIHTFEGNPEPWEKGAVLAALPTLGGVVTDMGITDKPIGEWSRDEICQFVWTCFRVIEAARVQRDEAPDYPDAAVEGAEFLEAG